MTTLKSLASRIAPGPYRKLQELRSDLLLKKVTVRVLDRYGLVVQAGPFAGMLFAPKTSDGSIVPKIIGSYEAELHDAIRSIQKNNYSTIINVGCAEGYYAVGLARSFPNATVHAFDLDPVARSLCAEMAGSNGVSVRIHGECNAAVLNAVLPADGRSLVVSDCEGAELEILDPSAVRGLVSSDLLIELHDFINPIISSEMQRRFDNTHKITLISSEHRLPEDFPSTAFLSDLEQRVALAEFRPEAMQWAFMLAR